MDTSYGAALRWIVIAAVLGCCRSLAPAQAVAQRDTLREPSQARVTAFLDSVQRTAGTHDGAMRAAMIMSHFGEAWIRKPGDAALPPGPVIYPGIVQRMIRLYRQSPDTAVRGLIIGRMIYQAERAEAVAFLGEVAQEPPEPPRPVPAPPPGMGIVKDDIQFPLQWGAIESLTYMGADGRAALERLQAQGTVREPLARKYLEELARQGFRRR